jgi:vanillate O-demethylase monooxygenase subunit
VYFFSYGLGYAASQLGRHRKELQMSSDPPSIAASRKPAVVPPAQCARFPRNQWYVAARRDEIGRSLLNRKLLGEQVVLYRAEDGRAVSLSDWCPHRRFRLSRSRLMGDVIQCGYHGLCFDSSGVCVKIPGQKTIPREMRVRSFPLVEKWFWCWIWAGEPDRADPALIPDLGALVDGEYFETLTEVELVRANFQLLLDNLADNTHASILHPGFLDNADNVEFTENPFHIEVKGSVVEATQRFENFTPAEGLAKFFGLEAGKPMNRVRTSREFMPSIHTSEDTYSDPRDANRILGRRVTFAPVTPADAQSAHIFGAVLTTADIPGPSSRADRGRCAAWNWFDSRHGTAFC